MNPAFRLADQLVAFIDTETHGEHIADDQEDTELPDMLKCGIDIFKVCKHGFDFNDG
jgi:hypothetical protein